MRPSLRGLDVAVLDLETTGLFPGRHDRIIELAVVRRRIGSEPRKVFSTLVNPHRDVGDTKIHGIRPGDLDDAPPFEEVAGDLLDTVAGSVIAGHNVGFDALFLSKELERAGYPADLGQPLCTLRVAARIGLDTEGRSLSACCQAAGVRQQERHAALEDALASSALLDAYVKLADERGIRVLEDLSIDVAACGVDRKPAPSGRCCPRTNARHKRSESYLAALIEHLAPSVSDHDADLSAYFELLDRVLEDGVVTSTEAEGLVDLASISGLGRERIEAAHRMYLNALATQALKDGIVTGHERYELDSVAQLLGFKPTTVDELLKEAADPAAALAAMRHDLRGKTVCFTGEICSSFRGSPISRELAEFLAREAGLSPVGGVTKKLDILVVADPHTMSTKARKARDYGVRIMSERSFWRAVGIEVA